MLQRHFKAIASPDIPSVYDLLVESHCGSFLKCQVKSTNQVETINGSRYWRFSTKKTKGLYGDGELHFFALVILPLRLVIFEKLKGVNAAIYRIKESDASRSLEERSLQHVLGEWL